VKQVMRVFYSTMAAVRSLTKLAAYKIDKKNKQINCFFYLFLIYLSTVVDESLLLVGGLSCVVDTVDV
jgi:hypothetical protein